MLLRRSFLCLILVLLGHVSSTKPVDNSPTPPESTASTTTTNTADNVVAYSYPSTSNYQNTPKFTSKYLSTQAFQQPNQIIKGYSFPAPSAPLKSDFQPSLGHGQQTTPVVMQYIPHSQYMGGVQYLQLIPTRPLLIPLGPYYPTIHQNNFPPPSFDPSKNQPQTSPYLHTAAIQKPHTSFYPSKISSVQPGLQQSLQPGPGSAYSASNLNSVAVDYRYLPQTEKLVNAISGEEMDLNMHEYYPIGKQHRRYITIV
ncbi:hypothetical protein ACFFRR_002446 [Megaselia abdita]